VFIDLQPLLLLLNQLQGMSGHPQMGGHLQPSAPQNSCTMEGIQQIQLP
jgi:hypothetical protein